MRSFRFLCSQMRNIITFNQLANAAIEKNAMHHRTKSAGGMERKLNFNAIKQNLGDLIYKLSSQKFEDPAEGEEAKARGPRGDGGEHRGPCLEDEGPEEHHEYFRLEREGPEERREHFRLERE